MRRISLLANPKLQRKRLLSPLLLNQSKLRKPPLVRLLRLWLSLLPLRVKLHELMRNTYVIY